MAKVKLRVTEVNELVINSGELPEWLLKTALEDAQVINNSTDGYSDISIYELGNPIQVEYKVEVEKVNGK